MLYLFRIRYKHFLLSDLNADLPMILYVIPPLGTRGISVNDAYKRHRTDFFGFTCLFVQKDSLPPVGSDRPAFIIPRLFMTT